MHTELDDDQIEFICKKINFFFNRIKWLMPRMFHNLS
jgi:hypothetical protein